MQATRTFPRGLSSSAPTERAAGGAATVDYFAYGSNLNAKAVAQWCRHAGLKPPTLRDPRAAVLDNYRLGFPIYSEYWGGGIADILPDPGKNVKGVVWRVSQRDLDTLTQKLNSGPGDAALHRQVDLDVHPLAGGPTIRAVAFTGVNPQGLDVPPTQTYLDTVVAGAYEAGLGTMWLSYLKSFDTQPARTPGRK